MVKGGEIGGFGGGSLEHPRQWLGAQWSGLSSPGSAAPPRAARGALCEEAQEPSSGTAKEEALPRGHF